MAAAALTHEHLVEAFEARFDYLTARTMLSEVLDNAQVGKAAVYDSAALAKISLAVEKLNRPQAIQARLGAAPAAKAPEAKAEAKVEAKAEAKVEPKPADPVTPAEPVAGEVPPAEAPADAPAADAPKAEDAAKPAEGHKHDDKKGKK